MFYNSTLTSTVDFIINHGVTSIAAVALSFIIHIIIISLILYLILRGFWIAIIGLSSAFPDGINISRLNFYKKYEERLKAADFEKMSIGMDKVCSSIFAFAFLLITLVTTMMMLIIYLFFIIAVLFSLTDSITLLLSISIIYLLATLFYLFDIILFPLHFIFILHYSIPVLFLF